MPPADALMMNLQTAMSYRKMGTLAREDLPDIATEALLMGEDTESLRLLAGLTPVEGDQAWDLFDLAIEELGLHQPNELEATRIVTASIAQRASTGGMSLHDAIRTLAAVCVRLRWQVPESMPFLDDALYLTEALDAPELFEWSQEELDQRCQEVVQQALMGG